MLHFDTREVPGSGTGSITRQSRGAKADTMALPPATSPPLSPEALDLAVQPTVSAYSPIVLAGTVRLVEFLLAVLVGSAIYLAYVVPVEGFEWHYAAAILMMAAMGTLAFQAADVYQVQAFRGHEKQYMRLAGAWSIVFLIAISVSFFTKAGDAFSRVWLGSFYVIGLVALVGFRRGLFLMVRRWTRQGRLDRRTVVVGADERGGSVIEAISAQRDSDIHIVGLFDDRGDDRAPQVIAGRRRLGTVDNLVEFARRTRIDLVIFALPISAENRILQMLRKLWVLPVDIRLAAHSNTLRFRPRAYSYIGNVPMLDVFDKPITDWDVVTKWLFDRIIGGLLLVLASPVMLLAAMAVKLDSRGPVFFKQNRYGFNNELIEVYKFRSLYYEHAIATAARLVTQGRSPGHPGRRASSARPRSTNCRSSSMWRARATLSLVGPRPHADRRQAANQLYDEAVDGYFARHRVKPGHYRLGPGQRLARRDRHAGKDPAAASSTTSTTSRIGRCCSTSTSWLARRSRSSTRRTRTDVVDPGG